MATRRPMFASAEPEVFLQASNSKALALNPKESNTQTRRPMFPSSEKDVAINNSDSARASCRQKVASSPGRRPTFTSDTDVDFKTSRSSSGRLVKSTSNSQASFESPSIPEIKRDSASQASMASSRTEVYYTPPRHTDPRESEELPRRIVPLCHAARFVAPFYKCTLTMQAGARKVEVAHATARKRQLKDFNVRLKCSCLPKKTRPPTPEPEDSVIALEPDEKYVGLQSDLFPEPLQQWPYVPATYYDTQETQVDCGHGQEFEVGDFDQEVESHLAKLVGTAVQQAMWEVVEHDELRVDKERRRRVASVIAGDKAEVTRLRMQDERLVAEKKRRIEQFKLACRLQEEVAALMQELSKWMPEHPWVQLEALEGFKKAGYLLQDIKDSVDRDAMTSVWKQTNALLDKHAVGRDLLAEMVENISLVRTVIHQILGRRYRSEIVQSETSSDSVDFFSEEWELKEAGSVEPKLSGRRADSLYDESNKSGKTMSETLADYLDSVGRTNPISDGGTSTSTGISWPKAVNFNRDLMKLYGLAKTLDDQTSKAFGHRRESDPPAEG